MTSTYDINLSLVLLFFKSWSFLFLCFLLQVFANRDNKFLSDVIHTDVDVVIGADNDDDDDVDDVFSLICRCLQEIATKVLWWKTHSRIKSKPDLFGLFQ